MPPMTSQSVHLLIISLRPFMSNKSVTVYNFLITFSHPAPHNSRTQFTPAYVTKTNSSFLILERPSQTFTLKQITPLQNSSRHNIQPTPPLRFIGTCLSRPLLFYNCHSIYLNKHPGTTKYHDTN